MRLCLICFVFLGFIGHAIAQDSTKVEEKIAYGMLGASIPISAGQYMNGNISLVVEWQEKYLLALRYYGTEYKHQAPASDDVPENHIPSHVYDEVNLSLGIVKPLHKKVNLYFSTGPSFVKYVKPYNLKEVPHPGNSWGGFFNFSIYEYEVRKYYLPGWSVRADLAFIPKRIVGLSVGAFYNYNKESPIGGMNVNVLFGRLKRKE